LASHNSETGSDDLAATEDHHGNGKTHEGSNDDWKNRCNEPIRNPNTETDHKDKPNGIGDALAKP
jgi:hypothetical protein